jgi:hypothetical protein
MAKKQNLDDIEDAKAEDALQDAEMLSDVSTTEEAMGKIIALLANEDKYKLITDVEQNEISNIAGLLAIADTYDITLLKNYLKNYLLLRISKKRLGRKEIVEMGIAKMQSSSQAGLLNRVKSVLGTRLI